MKKEDIFLLSHDLNYPFKKMLFLSMETKMKLTTIKFNFVLSTIFMLQITIHPEHPIKIIC